MFSERSGENTIFPLFKKRKKKLALWKSERATARKRKSIFRTTTFMPTCDKNGLNVIKFLWELVYIPLRV